MKRILFLIFCLALLSATYKAKKVEPVFPPDLRPNEKDRFMEFWMDGKSLFKSDCAKCHGVFTKGKDSIPNFSQVQLHNYSSRFIARDPKNHSIAQHLPEQDFTKILLFLTYLKREERGPVPLVHQFRRRAFVSLGF